MRVGLLLAALLSTGPARADDAYPVDITPPAGTQYPCALTPLPHSLPGIPESDRAYVNRTYARILRATQAKLVALKALEQRRDVSGAVVHYLAQTTPLAERLRAEPAPAGLGPFQDDVVQAVLLQQAFFRKAVPLRAAGRSMAEVYGILEGRYHHLCALDLF